MVQKRILWIDYAKVLGMYLVILGHTMLTPPLQYLQCIIYAFHMPLFFFISGFLHKSKKNNKEFFLACIKTLLIPFLFFNLLELIPNILNNHENLYLTTLNFLKEMGIGFFRGYPPVGPSWFILCLLWMKFLLWGCTKICRTQKSLIYTILLLTMITYVLDKMTYIQSIRILCIGNALLSFPFYAIGYITKLNYKQFKTYLNKNLLFIPIIILFFVVQYYNTMTSLQSCTTGKDFILMLITGFAGTLISIKICTYFKSENPLIYTLSAGSIVILCTHGFILNMTINKYTIGGEIYSPLWYIYSIIGCILIMLIEYPLIKFFFKYLKWSIGGRKL